MEKDGKNEGPLGGQPPVGPGRLPKGTYRLPRGGGVFGCLLERPGRGPKVNSSRVKANMETVEESGENVMSMGIGGVRLLGNERLEVKREDGTNRIGR